MIALDKIDKIGRVGVEKELQERGIVNEGAARLLTAFEFFIKNDDRSLGGSEKVALLKILNLDEAISSELKQAIVRILKIIEEWTGDSESYKEKLKEISHSRIWNDICFYYLETLIHEDTLASAALKQLRACVEYTAVFSPETRVRLDPSLARGLSYYTGAIMEINVPDLAGSFGGGGRYDGLIGMFGKEQIPACGFSLGLERILVVMEERGMFPPEIAASAPADVMVTIWNEDSIAGSLKLASELRSQGLRVTVYPEADKMGKQFKYADSIGVPFVCVLGDDEVSEGKVKLKNMASGDEWKLTPAEIAARINK